MPEIPCQAPHPGVFFIDQFKTHVVWFRLPTSPLTRVAIDSILDTNAPYLNHASLRIKSFVKTLLSVETGSLSRIPVRETIFLGVVSAFSWEVGSVVCDLVACGV